MSSRPSTLVGAVGSVNPVMSHSPIGIGDLIGMQIPILARFLSFWPQSTVSFVVPLAISEAPPLRILFGSLSLQFAGSIVCWIPFLTTLAVVGMLLLPLKLGSFRKLLLSSPTSLSLVKLIALLHGLGSPHPRMFGQIACKATLTNVGSNGQEMRRHICTRWGLSRADLELSPAAGNPDLKQGSPSMARDKAFLSAS
jgi:hypothetical protein